jgi:hypothetical protein
MFKASAKILAVDVNIVHIQMQQALPLSPLPPQIRLRHFCAGGAM